MDWVRRKGTTGEVKTCAQFSEEEKFLFQCVICKFVSEHDIPLDLVLNPDQTLLSYVSPTKCTFDLKGSTTVPIKGVNDKRQITATFAVYASGSFLPLQLMYNGKIKLFPYLKAKKEELSYSKEQCSLIVTDIFKGQENAEIKELCSKNECELVIVPHTLTKKF